MSDNELLNILVNKMLDEHLLYEMRTKGLYKSLRTEHGNIPDYVFNEFYKSFHSNFLSKISADTLYAKRVFDKLNKRTWTLERLRLSPKNFNKRTQDLFAEREFGAVNPYGVPRDAERMAIQKTRVFGDGNNEPIIIFRNSNGYDLSEGWHRTMNLLLLGKNSENMLTWDPVLIKAWVGS
jgi:hypothetical protein